MGLGIEARDAGENADDQRETGIAQRLDLGQRAFDGSLVERKKGNVPFSERKKGNVPFSAPFPPFSDSWKNPSDRHGIASNQAVKRRGAPRDRAQKAR